MPTTYHLGIDPGAAGGAVFIQYTDNAASVLAVHTYTTPEAAYEWLKGLRSAYPDLTVVCEHVHASASMGPSAAASFVGNYQLWVGLVWGLWRVKPTCVDPQIWQRSVATDLVPKIASAKILALEEPPARRTAYVAHARKLALQEIAHARLPGKWTLKTCDAALLALYAATCSRPTT